MAPKLYSGTGAWRNDNKNSWRDDSLQDSEIRTTPLSVICVKNEMNGNNGTCRDINECNDYDCGKGECRNTLGSYSCVCFDGFSNFKNDSSLLCGQL